jgi:hypothetical protein
MLSFTISMGTGSTQPLKVSKYSDSLWKINTKVKSADQVKKCRKKSAPFSKGSSFLFSVI